MGMTDTASDAALCWCVWPVLDRIVRTFALGLAWVSLWGMRLSRSVESDKKKLC
jgi:hypothetical protein